VSRPRTIAFTVIGLVTLVAYGATINDYFVQDDFGVVWLLSQKPASYFPRWFVSSWMDDIWGFTPDEVRPFVAVTYQMAAVVGAGSPVANHVLNVAWHGGCALLVFGVAQHAARLGLVASTIAAVIFVVLPNQAETAAWITGRVDSMPAFFYLASFLCFVLWRRNGSRAPYAWSVAWCFVALLSKQNTITLVPALVLYDVIAGAQRVTPSWRFVRPYAPHIVLTVAYLALRYVLFGEAVRESAFTAERFDFFVEQSGVHVMRIVFGQDHAGGAGAFAVAAAAIASGVAWVAARRRGAMRGPPLLGAAVYFGIVWMALGLLPTIVSTYASPRHGYLASVGWAIAAGVGFELLWRGTSRLQRSTAVAAAALLLTVYSLELRGTLLDWDARAALSARAVTDLEREANRAKEGTLILAGVPARSWAYALPFAARPPFTRADLFARVSIVSDAALHCCSPVQWDAYTRSRLREWLDRPDRPPMVILSWDTATGQLFQRSGTDDASMRTVIGLLLESGDQAALDGNLRRLAAEAREPVGP
jgi:hypothetical protein